MNTVSIRRAWTAPGSLALVTLASCALWFTSCQQIETESRQERPFSPGAQQTYAWATAPALSDLPGSRVVDQELQRRVREAVDAELRARGMREVDAGEADLLITQSAAVEVKVQSNDPYFSFNAADQVEEGAIQIHVLDGKDHRVLWSGTGRSRLRLVARGVGLHRQEFVPVDETRDWQVEAKVRAILARLPEDDAS